MSIRVLVLIELVAPMIVAAQSPARDSAGRSVIDGIVTDTLGVPLSAATVTLGSSLSVATGSNGRFQILSLAAGEYDLTTRRLGYRPLIARVRVGVGDTTRIAIALKDLAASLDTVRVVEVGLSPRMADFERRRTTGVGGHYVTVADIEKRRSTFMSEILRTIPGIAVRQSTVSGRTVYLAASSQMPFSPPGLRPRALADTLISNCWMQVAIDGVLMPAPFDLDQLPPVSDIAGIEVYDGPATVPPDFLSLPHTNCGLILVWTKD